MNSFANTLFAMLFGWARSVIQRVWSAAAEGRLSGFFTWLGDHWLWVALFLVLACTAADFIVWFVRWQPYKVWQTHVRALRRFFRGEWRQKKRFEQGYRDAVVPVDLTAASPAESAPDPQAWSEAEWAAPAESAYAPPLENAYFPPQQEAPRPRAFAPAEEAEAPQTDSEQTAVRRRRSEKYGKRRSALTQRLAQIAKDDVGMLDGLPPAVDRQSAFHEPVYPNQPTVTPAPNPWQGMEEGGRR